VTVTDDIRTASERPRASELPGEREQQARASGVSTGRVRRRALLVGRAVMATTILVAVVAQLLTSLHFWAQRGASDGGQNVVTYFSFFTVESNILSLVLLSILVAAQLGRPRIGRRFDVLLLCATSFMLVTGIVYNAMMRDIVLPADATVGWSNEVLHVVAPVWMLLDWFASPRLRDVRWRDLGTVLLFPAAWLAYTLIRAPKSPAEAVGNPYWYPPLDPSTYDTGYLGVIGTCSAVVAMLLVATAVLIVFARWQRSASA
jgi:hypothetical protein